VISYHSDKIPSQRQFLQVETRRATGNSFSNFQRVDAPRGMASSPPPAETTKLVAGPVHVLRPFRTDPLKVQPGQKRIDRLAAAKIPEIHYIGQIIAGSGLITSFNEGAACRSVFLVLSNFILHG
jgi:hypothetical protein